MDGGGGRLDVLSLPVYTLSRISRYSLILLLSLAIDISYYTSRRYDGHASGPYMRHDRLASLPLYNVSAVPTGTIAHPFASRIRIEQ